MNKTSIMEANRKTSRRNFIRNTSLAGAFSLALPQLVSASFASEGVRKRIALSKDDVILFQGDSITDASRKREDTGYNRPAAMGSGYALLASAELLHKYTDKNLKIYNRGISGNKVYQLAERWQTDALDLKPQVLSILIGVNDFWHMRNGKYNGTLKTYRDDYKALLERTRQHLPEVQLIIGEPFAVPGIKAVDEQWFPAFDDYRKTARELADAFGAVFIPYQSIFDKAQKTAPGVYWTHDGVHPSLAGAQLMAQAWLETVKG